MTDIELRSLAPEYVEDHHKTYVSRLNAAVTDTRNKNIALTGRYGAGKSSILDEFIRGQEETPQRPTSKGWRVGQKLRRTRHTPKRVLRISINTLGPDKGEDLTNRIQKELVKQLVYRAKPGKVRSSEFARAPELPWWRAGLEALAATAILVGLLWLFGVRPDKEAFGTDDFLWPMIVFSTLVFAILLVARRYVGNRVVAQVSAGGASLSLEGKTDSFFDKYLDELITFFEATEPDIVVFEDLDRFDDPRIFDSLRELNTLVNTSAHWSKRSERPLRFVYAIKDSLFEKLGDEQPKKDDAEIHETDAAPDRSDARTQEKKDAAAEAVERANRTKFFEIVIPVVPFLSHSNARDHLVKELEKLMLPEEESAKVDRGLIDIVARHTTDMRLMINIGNEFVVYAERMLWIDDAKRAPGLTADRLFALLVYKNFHLADFEALPHRGSALDALEKARRELVDAAIKQLRREHASLAGGETHRQRQLELATKLGERLDVFLGSTHMTLGDVTLDGSSLAVKATNEPRMWKAVARAKKVNVRLDPQTRYGNTSALDRVSLACLFPEIDYATAWRDQPTQADGKRLVEIDTEIAELRGADFEALFDDTRYKLNGETFALIAENTLPSRLAVDLVQRGHIDRFYAEYSTTFYGEFLGVDVANFFRNSVWPNEMDSEFKFTTPHAAENVLAQAPVDFLRTRSALNIDIVDHLMGRDPALSDSLVEFLARPNNAEGHQFLKTYFNRSGTRDEVLVSRLAAKPWPGLFSFIGSEETIDADQTNLRLLHAALLSAGDVQDFEVDDAARALLARLHSDIPAFRETQDTASAVTLFAFLSEAVPSIPNLRALSPELQRLVVDAKRYELTADNLRAAASVPNEEPISSDNLITEPVVWEYCSENIEDYLELVGSDEHTAASCLSRDVLVQVVNAQDEAWTAEQMAAFLFASAKDAAVPDIATVEQSVWDALLNASRAIPNVANLEAYATTIGVNDVLAALLTEDDAAVVDVLDLEEASEEQLEPLIPLLLNAQPALGPRQRVLLAKQLWHSPAQPAFVLTEVTASPDELLAELLRQGMVDDVEESFERFSSAGWASIGPALRVSKEAATFITPALIEGHAADLLRGESFPEATRRAVLDRLTEFAPTEDETFLVVAASVARTLRVRLSLEALKLIAPFVHTHEDAVWQLREHDEAIEPEVALQILGDMPGDFVGFAGSAGQKFEVQNTPSLGALLDRLKFANLVKLQQGGQPRGRWKLRIA
ncbi:hypothetical protein ABID81_002529 [Frigoribacterium sp. PvP054]|uniref:YobI family P-loop NTPase n=1 Tax=Frigoribacterium sp. PvP054 TaxID=3156438 RepID=UPI0033919350